MDTSARSGVGAVLATILAAAAVGFISLAVAGVIPGIKVFSHSMSPASVIYVAPFLDIDRRLAAPLLVFAILASPIGLILWQPNLLRGSDTFPTRSVVLIITTAITSGLYYTNHWREAMDNIDQGKSYVYACLAVSLVLVMTIAGLSVLCRRRPSFVRNLVTHALIFVWITTFAFPILGSPSEW